MKARSALAHKQRWVVKIGSALVTNDGKGLDTAAIAGWAEQIAQLRRQGKEVLLVSSGAVAEGMARLGWSARPKALHELQAAAAVGQMGLIQHYESCFKQHAIHAAQILLTHDDLSNRKRYLNARSTLKTLLKLGSIPIINENDTVATDEIRFGDNDTLAALVANLVEADALLILTDQDGVFTADPRKDASATLIKEAQANDSQLMQMAASSGGALGCGGMQTKIIAAQRAARSGTCTIIANGQQPNILIDISQGKEIGTLLLASKENITARKQWLAGHLKVMGTLYLDQGAADMLQNAGKSLLAVGVTKVEGEFVRGDIVSCLAPNGTEVARGLCNYGASETDKIKGHSSNEIENLLAYIDEAELIHRDNLVVI